ncbi:hypothetical protein H8D91_01385 [archaeon]|nr:hypothetical protein [archaeon]
MEESTLGFLVGVFIGFAIICVCAVFSTPLDESSKWVVFLAATLSGFCVGWVLEKIKCLQK